jgi:hypothetical protein
MKISIIIGILLLTISTSRSQNSNCGTERWNVKTLTDADTSKIDYGQTMVSSVDIQSRFPQVVARANDPRLPSEDTIYTIKCKLIAYKLEADGDYHLQIRDPVTDSQMVAEIPNPDCATVNNRWKAAWREARTAMDQFQGTPTSNWKTLPTPVMITLQGFGYYDLFHGQTGFAANNREIHPVMSVSITSNEVPKAKPGGFTGTVNVYPNPAHDQVLIEAFLNEEITGISIEDVNGKVVQQQKVQGMSCRISVPTRALPVGIYFAKVVSETGMIVKKFRIHP